MSARGTTTPPIDGGPVKTLSRPQVNCLCRSAILARTIGQAVPEPDFNCLMVRSRLQHHVCLGDSIDERACIDLLRARRVVVSVETGEPIKHRFLCGTWGMEESMASLSRLLSPECVPVKDQRQINFAVMTRYRARHRCRGRWVERSSLRPPAHFFVVHLGAGGSRSLTPLPECGPLRRC